MAAISTSWSGFLWTTEKQNKTIRRQVWPFPEKVFFKRRNPTNFASYEMNIVSVVLASSGLMAISSSERTCSLCVYSTSQETTFFFTFLLGPTITVSTRRYVWVQLAKCISSTHLVLSKANLPLFPSIDKKQENEEYQLQRDAARHLPYP